MPRALVLVLRCLAVVAVGVTLARRSVAETPEWVTETHVCLEAAQRDDAVGLRECSQRLVHLAPKQAVAWDWACISAMRDGRFDDADDALAKARALGLDDRTFRTRQDRLDHLRGFRLGWGGRIFFAWLAILVGLFGIGHLLSHRTLQVLAQAPREATGRPQAGTLRLFRVYRMVLSACTAYFYVSLPVILALVGGLIWLAVSALKYAYGQAILFVVGWVVASVTLFVTTLAAMIQGLLATREDHDPGIAIDLEAIPALRTLLFEVARKVGTRPVDFVYVSDDAGIGVLERRGDGRTERLMVIGMAFLDGLRLRELRATLAHEFGHFRNRDTALGDNSLRLLARFQHLQRALRERGADRWYSPMRIFTFVFVRAYLRVACGARRLQESLADRWAGLAYGRDANVSALRHSYERGVWFKARCLSLAPEALAGQRVLNAYVDWRTNPEALAAKLRAQLDESTNAYDAHPSFRERVELLERLGLPDVPSSPDDEIEVWSLFPSGMRRELELRLTPAVEERARKMVQW